MTRARDDSEAAVSTDIRLDLGRDPDVVLWRNTTGEAMHVAEDGPDAGRAHRQRFGLAVGSADFIGIVRVEVPGLFADRPTVIGRFLSLEVKRPKVGPTLCPTCDAPARARDAGTAICRSCGGSFVAVRAQDAGTLTPDQRRWRDCVRMRGGVAVVVRSAAEAIAVVERAKRDPSWLGEGFDE